MNGLIAYTGPMPAKRKAARGRFEMVLSPVDEQVLTALEKKVRLNRTAVVRLAIGRLADSEGVVVEDLPDTKPTDTGEG